MKLIVGLGNPGREYENTRHNVGFSVIDNYITTKNLGSFKLKFNGLFIKAKLFNEDVIFLKPQSYMNLSGEVVRKYVDFYKIINDLDLDIGNFRLRPSGSSGGHNGLKNIELHLNTNKYKRLKVGISNRKDIDTKDYVLGKINSADKKILDNLNKTFVNILNDFFTKDFATLMSMYNRKNR